MVDSVRAVSTPIVPVGDITWSPTRRSEPVTIGVPVRPGVAFSSDDLSLEDQAGRPCTTQVRPLDRWPDGSIRWALIDGLVDVRDGRAETLALRCGKPAQPPPAGTLRVDTSAASVRVSTGTAMFEFSPGGSFPISDVIAAAGRPIDAGASGLAIEFEQRVLRCRIAAVKLEETGPVRAAVEVRGVVDGADSHVPLDVFARIEMFAGSATLRMTITLRNTRRATHPGGYWTLGDPGSVLLDSAVLALKVSGRVTRLECASEFGEALGEATWPLTIYQESSGGENWSSPVHRERDGQVQLRYRGYRREDGAAERTGHRATPIVVVHTPEHTIGVAMPNFWQNFPRAIAVRDDRIDLGFFPRRGQPHELQGGEQKSHVAVVAFAADGVSDPPLSWVHDPVLIYPPPDWCCDTGAVPFLVPAASDPDPVYRELVASALDPEAGFLRKRELADEYGWRHFGDLPADHESAFMPPGTILPSHYNNQYDAIACFAIQFLRSSDRRWWQLMRDLACHMRDIDIYHTDQDKAAYNGGLFWHTWHYFDAGTSTHRSYPRESPASGGPSAEHNYNLGLMLHYFMTGEPASRLEAVNLGRWVLDMDDGRLTVFRWLAGGSTGLASSSGSETYHGPGRGGANSILACLVAYRLTGDSGFSAKADSLIRRCIHPEDDVESRRLLDVERRWSYTVFLQVLGYYLHDKWERDSFDEMFFYARDSLLHYARWMVSGERPYLDHPETLEYPNETWTAQDLRKADVLYLAAMYAEPVESEAFLARATFFRESSLTTLVASPNHTFTRPTVLALGNGVRFVGYRHRQVASRETPAELTHRADPQTFEPQKVRALRRAAFIGVALGLSLLTWVLS